MATLPDTQAGRCAERIRRESEIAKIEYQRDLLRRKWRAALDALTNPGDHPGERATEEVKRWAAALEALDQGA